MGISAELGGSRKIEAKAARRNERRDFASIGREDPQRREVGSGIDNGRLRALSKRARRLVA
jgi:hypothetical protein